MLKIQLLAYFTLILGVQQCHAIIGGRDACPEDFPFIVSLRNETGLHYCGGALITRKHIVTAAHCMYSDKSVFTGKVKEELPVENVTVLVDTVSSEWTPGTKYAVAKLTPHPDYDIMNTDNFLEHDIGIVTLKEEVTLDRIKPITRSKLHPVAGDKATVAGWGVKDPQLINELVPASVLQEMKINIVDKTECHNYFTKANTIFGNMIGPLLKVESVYCGFKDAQSGTCYRDSGSPMIVNGELAGIVIYGMPCAKNFSDVYTSVAYYADFIDAQLA